MDKRLIFPGNSEKGRDLFFVQEDRNYLRKHAGSYHPKVAEYIEKAKPLPNLVQVLLTALGAYEFWGQNVNGDRFRVPALEHRGDDYGYETFKSNANYFTHHVNKDPALAKGKVLHAVWNEKSKRVELVVGIDINLDPEAIASVDRGDSLAFSMGAKVPFDVCSICANKAKTRADYCDHLICQMNTIDPMTNKLVGADNLFPRFFDISRVLIPADRTAYMWTKVASAAGENPFTKLSSALLAELPPGKLNDMTYLQEKVAEQRELTGKTAGSKNAAVRKSAEMTKRIPMQTVPPKSVEHLEKIIPPAKALLQATAPALPPEVIARIRALAPSLAQLLATTIAVGIEPTASEVKLATGVDLTAESLKSLKISEKDFFPKLAEEFIPVLEERSFARPFLASRLLSLASKFDYGASETIKIASNLQKTSMDPAIPLATLLGLAATAGHAHAGAPDMLSKLIKMVQTHPVLSAVFALGLYSAAKSIGGTQTIGVYDVDGKDHPLYNNDYQSRFARLQARPVTVIKTGAVDTEVAKKLYYGVPLIFAGSHAAKVKRDVNDSQGQRTGKLTHFVADHPELVAGGMFAEHFTGRPISKHVAKALESGKRIFKHASIRDLEFLNSVPEEDKPLFWDLAILDASARIAKKLGG